MLRLAKRILSKPTTVVVPAEVNLNTIDWLLEQFVDEEDGIKANYFSIDLKRLKFVEPIGITVLGNLIEWLSANDVHGSFLYTDNRACRYLHDAGFFYSRTKKAPPWEQKLRPTLLPLEIITPEKSYSWLVSEFTPWLARCTNIPMEALNDVRANLGEIFNNIRDHAGTLKGCICAQHYPKDDLVKIAVSDFGTGIPGTLASKYDKLSDGELIVKATEYGVTSGSSDRNMGAGLANLVTYVSQTNGGIVRIRSLYGCAECERDGDGQPIVRYWDGDTQYRGTLFEIEIRTDTIDVEPLEEDLSWF